MQPAQSGGEEPPEGARLRNHYHPQRANHAREVAKLELHSIEDQVATERNLRSRELKERKQQMKAKKELHAKIRKREKEKQDQITKEAEMVGRDIKVQQKKRAVAMKEEERMDRRVTTYEEAFQKIKEATGIYEVNELVQKVLNQDETKVNLRQLVKENQAKEFYVQGLTENYATTIRLLAAPGAPTLPLPRAAAARA